MIDLTVSLETAKKLKEAGFPQASQFWYLGAGSKPAHVSRGELDGTFEQCKEFYAPTLSELLAEMPETIITENETWGINLTRKDGLYMSMYAYYDKDKKQQVTRPSYVYVDENSAECMAGLFLILKQENLI